MVVCAEDGRQALDYMSSSTPGLILLDLMMPNMSGWEFLERQKQDPRLAAVPVVLISGSGLARDTDVVETPGQSAGPPFVRNRQPAHLDDVNR